MTDFMKMTSGTSTSFPFFQDRNVQTPSFKLSFFSDNKSYSFILEIIGYLMLWIVHQVSVAAVGMSQFNHRIIKS